MGTRPLVWIIFFGVAGIALVAIFLVLHMTAAAGTINGLILYANIVSVHRSVFLPSSLPPAETRLGIFIAWLNFDLGIPVCFYDGLDSYVYSWLQYIFPLYLWVLIGVIILSSKLSVRVRKFGSNPVAVFMSYAKQQ